MGCRRRRQEIEDDVFLFPPGTQLPIGPDGNIALAPPLNQVLFPDGFIGNPEVFERHFRFDVSAFFSGFERHLVRTGAGIHYGDLYKVKEAKNFGPGVIDGSQPVVDGQLTDVTDTPFAFLPVRACSR